MLVDMVAVGLVEVAVVEVVHMAAVFYRCVAAAGSVDMGMVVVDIMLGHDCFFSGMNSEAGVCAGNSLAWAMALNTRSRTCWSASA